MACTVVGGWGLVDLWAKIRRKDERIGNRKRRDALVVGHAFIVRRARVIICNVEWSCGIPPFAKNAKDGAPRF